jgi:hypothetical protein
MPHLSWNQASNWTDEGEISDAFYSLARSGKANPAQEQFAGPRRPQEYLFDCRTDPMNLTNLADSPQHQARLDKMREALNTHLNKSHDLGFIPEIEMWRRCGNSPPMTSGIANDRFAPSRKAAADLVGSDDLNKVTPLLTHEDASVRYWGAVCCSAASVLNEPTTAVLKRMLLDESPAVQIEAANALYRHGHRQESNARLVDLLSGDDLTVLLYTARTIELLADAQNRQPMQTLFDRFEDDPRDMAWFIRFTTTGYLSRLTQN